jgi:hypothetical protein
MERITGKQVQSMMEALNQVYVQPEVEQLDDAPAPAPAKTYKVGDKQMSKAEINREYARLRKDDPAAAKAFGDKAFRATNPKLADASAERARIRGTAQTDNPLMKDMRSRMPAGAPTVQSPAVAKLGAGNQSLVNNPNAGRAATPAAKFNPNAPRVTPTGTPRPTAGAAAFARPAAATPAAKFNPNAPRVTPTGTPRPTAGASAVARPTAAPAPRPTAAPAPRPAATSFNPNAPRVVPTAPRPTTGASAVQQRRQRIAASADLFDIVRGELLDEGYSEEDAMYIMANLNDEQREIVMNEGIGALVKLGAKALRSGAGKKLLSKATGLIKGGKKGTSAIGKRASKVVKDQRAGVAGTADDLNRMQLRPPFLINN